MHASKLVIATRRSPLALKQAEHVQCLLHALYPKTELSLLKLSTRGDQILDRSLSKIGGKGLFINEIESALTSGQADLAVHSLKDMPAQLSSDFTLAAIPERADPRDAFVSIHYTALAQLPPNSKVGTSSLRREVMLRTHYPKLQVHPLRGNIGTRLHALEIGQYTAIILAAAGLKRLGLDKDIKQYFEPEDSLPCAGQGALGIEILSCRSELAQWLLPLNHFPTALAVQAERTVSRVLGGSCQVPLAAFANWQQNTLYLSAQIALPDGSSVLYAHQERCIDTLEQATALGQTVALDLIQQGANQIMAQLNLNEMSAHQHPSHFSNKIGNTV